MIRKIGKIIKHPCRWRRSLGFGVHSPFAFSFITKVLNETEAAYYAYAEIDALCPKRYKIGFNEIFAGGDFAIPEAHMLFRVLCRINPPTIIEIGNGHEVTHLIIKRSVPGSSVLPWHSGRPVEITRDGTVFILVNELQEKHLGEAEGFIKRVIKERPAVLFVRNLSNLAQTKQLWNNIVESMDYGMAFFDDYTGIFIGSPKLPYTIYPLVFPG